MEKLTAGDPDTQSADVVTENIEALRVLFPAAFSEGRVDFDVLRQLLGDAIDDGDERYGLTWRGKRAARRLALTPSNGTLRPAPEESVNWDTTQNLMIEGDNLEVLKLLQKSYAGKVKLIYIDPPYNTGKDFVYPDDFQDNIKNYLEITGQVGEQGRLTSNAETSGRYHTDWLNMVLPRLSLARDLLQPDGVILVSINDIEAPRLRIVLDEVFGEGNFLCQFVWNNEGNVDQQSKIKGVHEYVLAYVRDLSLLSAPTVIDPNIEETSKLYNDQIENSITKNGPANPPSEVLLPAGFPATFTDGEIAPRQDKWPHILDAIRVVNGKLAKPARVYSGWSSRNLLDLFIQNGLVPISDGTGRETSFSLTPTGAIYGYKRRSEDQGHVLSVIRNVGTTKQNSNMLASWGISFSYPKPILLIQYLISVFTSQMAQHLVMDLFAGSGTTGHATFRLNKADGGNRRLALVQLPEPAESGKFKTIADVTKERLRMAATEIRGEAPMFGGDLGFRVFKLDSSNIREWEPDRDDVAGSLDAAMVNLKTDRTEQDVLFELLLKRGIELTVPIEQRQIAKKTVHSIGAGTLFACLAERIERQDAEPLALGIVAWHKELAPAGETRVVFRDSAFVDDVAKTNLAEILKQHGLTDVKSI